MYHSCCSPGSERASAVISLAPSPTVPPPPQMRHADVAAASRLAEVREAPRVAFTFTEHLGHTHFKRKCAHASNTLESRLHEAMAPCT
eukprot:6213790-Pleurochrysis_carterae.AAC.1